METVNVKVGDNTYTLHVSHRDDMKVYFAEGGSMSYTPDGWKLNDVDYEHEVIPIQVRSYNPELDSMILLNLDGESLIHVCNSDKYYNSLCNEWFWKRKVEKDYGEEVIPWINVPYKRAYARLTEMMKMPRIYLSNNKSLGWDNIVTQEEFYIVVAFPYKRYIDVHIDFLRHASAEKIIYMFENGVNFSPSLVDDISALGALKYIYERYGVLPQSILGVNRDKETVEWLMSKGMVPSEKDAKNAAYVGNLDALDVMGILPPPDAFTIAAHNGNINMLNWLKNHGVMPEANVSLPVKAIHGNVPNLREILLWITRNVGIAQDEYLKIQQAAITRNILDPIPALLELEKFGIPITANTAYDNVKIWEYLIKERGIIPPPEVYLLGMIYGNYNLLEFLYENGVPYNHQLVEQLKNTKVESMKKWFKERGYF